MAEVLDYRTSNNQPSSNKNNTNSQYTCEYHEC